MQVTHVDRYCGREAHEVQDRSGTEGRRRNIGVDRGAQMSIDVDVNMGKDLL